MKEEQLRGRQYTYVNAHTYEYLKYHSINMTEFLQIYQRILLVNINRFSINIKD